MNHESRDGIMTEFQKKVYTIVRKIPRGKVATYAAIARSAGRPRAFRAVGGALNKNPEIAALPRPKAWVARDDKFCGIPCHRVIRSDGAVGGYARGTKEKIKLLRKEGLVLETIESRENLLLHLTFDI